MQDTKQAELEWSLLEALHRSASGWEFLLKKVSVFDNCHNKTLTQREESQHWSFSSLSYQPHQLSSWLPSSPPVSLPLEAGTIWRSTLELIGLCWIDWTNQRRDWQGQKVSSSIRWWVLYWFLYCVALVFLCLPLSVSYFVCFSASLCTPKILSVNSSCVPVFQCNYDWWQFKITITLW